MIDNNYFEFVKEEFRKEGESSIPVRSTEGSAGYDFITPISFTVPANGCSDMIFTNIKAHIKNGYFLALFIRSSIAMKKHCTLINQVGVIDGDYFSNPDNDGNIGFKLYNTSNQEQKFEAGERIFQGIFIPYGITANDNCTSLRTGGFGSTDK